MLIFGFAMVVIMIWKPRGLISTREPTAFLKENGFDAAALEKVEKLLPTAFDLSMVFNRWTFGDGSSATSLLDGLGVVDVAQEIGWVGEKPMTDEALVAADPVDSKNMAWLKSFIPAAANA